MVKSDDVGAQSQDQSNVGMNIMSTAGLKIDLLDTNIPERLICKHIVVGKMIQKC